MLTLRLTQLIYSTLMKHYNQVNKELQKVLTSQCFSKSVVLKELFKYLVEKSVKGEELREIEIAYEIFGKRQSQEKEKNIRIYIFNLRKKLKEYYTKEGTNDEIVFSIPKGSYEVDIKVNRKLLFTTQIAKLTPYLLLLSALLLTLTLVVYQGKSRSEITKSFIWSDIYKSDYPLLIVLGDHYFVKARNTLGQMGTTRYLNINSDKDFEELLTTLPPTQDDFQKTSQTYINKQAPFALYKVLSFLGGNQIEIDMRYSSALQWEHLTNRNTLFIGSYKTQGILKTIFEKTGISFDSETSELSYSYGDSIAFFSTNTEEFLTEEFASLIHFKTSDGRIVMALMCNTDLGNIATIKYLSQPENLKELKQLQKKYPHSNFKAIFEVSGQNQTDFQISLKEIDPIELDIDKIWP